MNKKNITGYIRNHQDIRLLASIDTKSFETRLNCFIMISLALSQLK